ncbi:MAG TPA: TIR domain-containing protein [Phycisphaerae bacterium]|nr:TIR domain-containing protein [Phycisphaerae bacterium]
MSEQPTTIYVCFEPEHRLLAERVNSWPRTNSDLDQYAARIEHDVGSPAAETVKGELRQQILAATVFVCVVGQTTFMDPWIDWEIRTARDKPGRGGLVAIMLDDLYPHPPGLRGAGTMFVKIKQTFVMDAVAWASEEKDPGEDYILEE